ncbi:hypothetical protein H0H87_000083 [Tephrocybe sp. NHM501043]|nr:hypothetical protein H0H87_000083 [Tephrocybe sp. NHM501043]
MKSFFQRISESHTGTRKPSNDPNPTHQVWLPPDSNANDDRTRHRANQEPTDASLSRHRTGEKRSSSRAPRAPDPNYEPHTFPSSYHYTTYPSSGKGSHTVAHPRATSTTAALPPPRLYSDPRYPDGSVGWSSQHPPAHSLPPPPEAQNHPFHQPLAAARTDISTNHHRRPDSRLGEYTKAREREYHDKESGPSTLRSRDMQKYPEESGQTRRRDKDGDKKRERKTDGRDRHREGRDTRGEGKTDSERERDRGDGWAREREDRRERDRLREREKERRNGEKDRERERDRDRYTERECGRERDRRRKEKDRGSEKDYGREQDRELRGQRVERRREDRYEEQEAPKSRERDVKNRSSAREQEYYRKAPGQPTEKPGARSFPEVYRQDGDNAHSTLKRLPERDGDENVDRRRRLDTTSRQRERSVDVRKDKHNYLDKRYEPERTARGSAAISQSHPHGRHRRPPANDETTSDSSPRKQLPQLSKHKRNLTDVEAINPSAMKIWKGGNSVPSAPSDPALAQLRQATFASSSNENQARNLKTNPSAPSLEHDGRELTKISNEQLSRHGPSSSGITLGELDGSTRRDHAFQNGSQPDLHTPQSLENDIPAIDVKPSKGLSSRWPFRQRKLSSEKPSIYLVENAVAVPQAFQQRPDIPIETAKPKYSSASQQAALREARNHHHTHNIEIEIPSRTTEKNSTNSRDEPSVLPAYPTALHHESHPQAQVQSTIPSVKISAQTADIQGAQPHETNISQATPLHPSQPQPSQAYQQTAQVPFTYTTGRTPSDPTVVEDLSRKRTESAASKHRVPTAGQDGHSVFGTSKASKTVVQLDTQPSVAPRLAAPGRVSQPIEMRVAPEADGRRVSQLNDTRPHVPSSHGVFRPLNVYSASKDSSFLDASPSHLSEDSPQHYSGLGGSTKPDVPQGTLPSSIMTTEHDVLSGASQESVSIKRQVDPAAVPIVSPDIPFPPDCAIPYKDSRYTNSTPQQRDPAVSQLSSILDNHFLDAARNISGMASTQYTPGAVEQDYTRGPPTRTQGILSDNAPRFQAYPPQDPLVVSSETISTSIPIATDGMNDSTSDAQKPILIGNIAIKPSQQTHTTLPLEQPSRVIESHNVQTQPSSTHQTTSQQRVTGTIVGTGHSNLNYQRTLQDINPPIKNIPSQPPSQPTSTRQTHSESNQIMNHKRVHPGISLNAKTKTYSIDPTIADVPFDARGWEHEEATGILTLFGDPRQVGNARAVREAPPFAGSVAVAKDAEPPSVPLVAYTQGAAREIVVSKLVAQTGDSVKHADEPKLLYAKIDTPSLTAESEAPLIPIQLRSEIGHHIPRSSTAIGHRHVSGENGLRTNTRFAGSMSHHTAVSREFSADNMKTAFTIQRPATAMGSREHRFETLQSLDPHSTALTMTPANLLQPVPKSTGPTETLVNGPPMKSTEIKISHHTAHVHRTPSSNTDIYAKATFESASSKIIRAEPLPASNVLAEDQLYDYKPPKLPELTSASMHSAIRIDTPKLGSKGAIAEVRPHKDIPGKSHDPPDHNGAIEAREQTTNLDQISTTSVYHRPIQNPKLAELLSNPGVDQPVSETESKVAIMGTSRHQPIDARPSPELPATRSIQPDPAHPLSDRHLTQRVPRETDSRTFVAQGSTPSVDQPRSRESHPYTPAPTIEHSAVDSGHSYPQNNGPPRITRANKESNITQKPTVQDSAPVSLPASLGPQQHVETQLTSQNLGYIEPLAPVLPPPPHDPHQPLHTSSRNHDPNKASHRQASVDLISSTHPLQSSSDGLAGVTVASQAPSPQEQVPSQRVSRRREHTKISHKQVPVAQYSSHTPYTVPTLNISPTSAFNQQERGASSTRNHDYNKQTQRHPLVIPSPFAHTATSVTSRNGVTTQRAEIARNRGPGPNNSYTPQVDLTSTTRHVLPTSQISQPRQHTSVSVQSHSVPSSVDPATISRMHPTSARPTVPSHPSENRLTPGTTLNPGSQTRATVTTDAPNARLDAYDSQSIPTSRMANPVFLKSGREVSRKPSEDSMLLRTPSSLAPTVLKPTESRTSIPASFSSQTSSKRRGLFSIFRSKTAQQSAQAEEPPSTRKSQKEPRMRAAETPSQGLPTQDTKTISSRVKPPSMSVPIPIEPVSLPDRKSPKKVFTPFRYLTTKRNRRVSAASLEAQDGTAPNTVIGSPTASMHSTQPPPMHPPPLRDVFAATQEWRHMEAAEVREVTGGKLRRARPGVVFDVAEDHTEERRRKIKPQSRQS